MASEREWFELTSAGDAGALEQLMMPHLPGLRRFMQNRAGDLLDIESVSDLVQSVCRETLEALAQERFEYQGEAEFKQWLYNAALFKLKNRRRYWHADRRAGARDAGPGLTEDEVRALSGASPSQHALENEGIERLRCAFERLPDNYRHVIRRARFEQASHREVAAELGITEKASRGLLARALARLAMAEGPGNDSSGA